MTPRESMKPSTVVRGAVGLAGAAVGLVGSLARTGLHAPVTVTRGALHLAGSAVSFAGTVACETARMLSPDQDGDHGPRTREAAPAGATDDSHPADHAAGSAASAAGSEEADAPPGPTVVAAEPHAPDQPPVDVVGEALAAEAAAGRGEGPDGAGLAHEPRAASRDEDHGDAALQRAEVDEIAEETAAALEGDVEPEEHLAEPLFDAADAKAMAAELKTMGQAADPDKG